MKIIERYQAEDGREFATAEECEFYERDSDAHALVGLGIADMTAVLDGDAPDLALALERLGTRLRKARQDRGEKLRGGARGSDEPAAQPPAQISPPRYIERVSGVGFYPPADEDAA